MTLTIKNEFIPIILLGLILVALIAAGVQGLPAPLPGTSWIRPSKVELPSLVPTVKATPPVGSKMFTVPAGAVEEVVRKEILEEVYGTEVTVQINRATGRPHVMLGAHQA